MKIRPRFTYHELLHMPGGYLIYTEANRFYVSKNGDTFYNADNYNDCYRAAIEDKQAEYFTQATNGNY